MNYCIASDYASVSCGKVSMYFGYEETVSNEEDSEWCFVVKESGVETMRIPQSKLKADPGSDAAEYLLAGMAAWLDSHISQR